jgi:hypothetical protein
MHTVIYQGSMKAKVYFCTESDSIGIILRAQKISSQALDTIYELVWECEFKNILNAGRIWLKFREQERPFGIPLRQRRSHRRRISPGDIIQVANDFYIVGEVGARQIELMD